MLQLQLLGGLSLSGPNGNEIGRATQRKRLVLLAILARSPRRTATRDRLIGLLWPECPEGEARARLSTAVYDLRRALGSDAIVSHGDDVSLNGCELDIDAERFEHAAAAGRWAEALELYSGPFLDGVYLEETDEFERWAQAQRDRLHQIWERAGQAARSTPALESAPSSLMNGSFPQPAEPARRRRALPWLVLGALGAGAVALGVAVARPDPPQAPTVNRIALFPFRVAGDSGIPGLAHGLADLVSLDLDGAGDIRIIDPDAVLASLPEHAAVDGETARRRARRLGATHYGQGFAYLEAGRLKLGLTLYEVTSDRVIAQASTSGPGGDLAGLVDRLSQDVLSGFLDSPKDRLAHAAMTSTGSFPALKTWLAGEAEFRRGRYDEAARAFELAATLDSTFALAHYRHSLATLWGDRPGASTDRHDALARTHASSLPPRYARLFEGYAAWRAGDPDRAEQVYRQVLVTWPDDVEAWYQLGETLFHYNPMRGRAVGESRHAFERVLLSDSAHRGARKHLALLDALAGQTGRFRLALDQLAPQLSSEPTWYGLRLSLAGWGELEGASGPLQSADEGTLAELASRVAVFLGDLDGAERIGRLLVAPGRNDYAQYLGRTTLGHLARARGRLREAAALLEGARPVGPGVDIPLTRTGMLTHWWAQGPDAELKAERDRLTPATPHLTPSQRLNRLYGIGLLDLLAGDTAGLGRVHRESARVPADSAASRFIRLALLGLQATRNGHPQEAVRLFEQLGPPGWFGYLQSGALQGDPVLRFARAEALLALGREEEALGWYGSFGEHSIQDLAYLAPAHFRRGEILERRGKRQEARREFERVVALWDGADPELQPWVARARARRAARGIAASGGLP